MLQRAARKVADVIGRESGIARGLRPAYESLLNWVSLGRGLRWEINGVPYRIDARYRHRFARDYDAPVAAYFRARLRAGACCFDVGANVGIYVLQFAHWTGPSGHVVAFEPNPGARDVLATHVALNGLARRVTVVDAALSDAPGHATMYAAGADGMSRLDAPNRLLADHARPITVPVTTLDAYCASTARRPDGLLIDVEGFEIAVLKGAMRTLRGAALAAIVVEMHPDVWASANTTRGEAEATLAALGLAPVPLTGQRDPLGEYGLVALEAGR